MNKRAWRLRQNSLGKRRSTPDAPAGICRHEHGASGTVRHDESMHVTERSQALAVMGAIPPPRGTKRTPPAQPARPNKNSSGWPAAAAASPPRRTRAGSRVHSTTKIPRLGGEGSARADVTTTKAAAARAGGWTGHLPPAASAVTRPNGSSRTGT
jgi:hypothetical protein